MKTSLALLPQALTVAFALVVAVRAQAQTPDRVRIRSIDYAGTGCPAGSVAEDLSPDYQAFTLMFDSFVAEVGPDAPLRDSRKNCQILVDLDFPQGWSYSLVTFDYRGFVDLERGVTGLQKSTYYFQGDQRTAPLAIRMRGPVNRDYQIRDTLGLEALVWSPCGEQRALNINSQVRLDAGGNRDARGLMTLDSLDGQVRHIYGLQWRRCGT